MPARPETTATQQRPDGRFEAFHARDASINGATAVYENDNGKNQIGCWSDPKDSVSWSANVTKIGCCIIAVRPKTEPKWNVIGLKSVVLTYTHPIPQQ